VIDVRTRLLRRGDYIFGSFVRPSTVDGYIVAVNPGDRSDVLGRFAFSLVSVDDAVGAAREAMAPWSALSVAERTQCIARFGEKLEEAADTYAMLITREGGKPLWEARAEVDATVRAVRLLLADGPPMLDPRVLQQDTAWSERRPVGVVAVITPFTYPMLVPAIHILVALLAGNAVVFKPSKFAPGVGQALAELLDRCRLPRGTFNLVQGSGASVGARLAAHPGIDALLFTGSHRTAAKVRRSLDHRPELPVFFNCGGKGAAIVLDDANLDLAAYELCVSAFATGGQRPDAAARVFVAKPRFDQFCDRVAERIGNLKVGYGFDDGVFLGPMISDTHRRQFRGTLDALSDAGHAAIVPGGFADMEGRRGFYVRPAMHWVLRDEALAGEPVGPVIQVYSVDGEDHAVSLHERLPSRLATAVFTRDERRFRSLGERLTTGALHMNRGTSGAALRLASVGRGHASNGLPGATELIRFLAVPRAVVIDRREYDRSRYVPGAGPLPSLDDDGETIMS
jgi:acyl-CoA reductase-like NAD-dependent aldehyde dehydrogenase